LLRILVSAYDCEPNRGSENGVGWNWARIMAGLGHQVTVVTASHHMRAIESWSSQNGKHKFRIVYFGFPWPYYFGAKRARAERLHYCIWQLLLPVFMYFKLLPKDYDVALHLTWGTVRFPVLLWLFKEPMVLGPLAGAELNPRSLERGFTVRARAHAELRRISTVLMQWDPLARLALARARFVLFKTSETKEWLLPRGDDKCRVFLEIDGPTAPLAVSRHQSPIIKLLYVGRLLGL
jgi:hypothetical protein